MKSIICKCGKKIEDNRILSKQSLCHSCQLEYQRKNRLKYKDMPEDRKKKAYVRSFVGQHLRRGKIKKQPCEVCNSEKSEMHHDDYNNPLLVRWLCRKHHLEYHKNNKNVF